MNIYEIRKEIIKLDDFEKRQLILDMLVEKEISFVDVTLAYINILQNKDERQQGRIRQFASCLASKYNEYNDMEFIDARSSLLLQPYVPDKFIKDYVIKKTSRKAINKEKKFFKKEGILE